MLVIVWYDVGWLFINRLMQVSRSRFTKKPKKAPHPFSCYTVVRMEESITSEIDKHPMKWAEDIVCNSCHPFARHYSSLHIFSKSSFDLLTQADYLTSLFCELVSSLFIYLLQQTTVYEITLSSAELWTIWCSLQQCVLKIKSEREREKYHFRFFLNLDWIFHSLNVNLEFDPYCQCSTQTIIFSWTTLFWERE